MVTDRTGQAPRRHEIRLDKYDGATGAHQETIVRVVWQDTDGTQITDPARIVELEAQREDHHGESGH